MPEARPGANIVYDFYDLLSDSKLEEAVQKLVKLDKVDEEVGSLSLTSNKARCGISLVNDTMEFPAYGRHAIGKSIAERIWKAFGEYGDRGKELMLSYTISLVEMVGFSPVLPLYKEFGFDCTAFIRLYNSEKADIPPLMKGELKKTISGILKSDLTFSKKELGQLRLLAESISDKISANYIVALWNKL